jgi:hypothetical protein
VLSCINYKIEEKVTLPSADSALIENRYDHIIEFYNEKYGINISSFTTPEQVGTFMYAMVQNDLSISKLE